MVSTRAGSPKLYEATAIPASKRRRALSHSNSRRVSMADHKRGRDAGTGQFIPVQEARERKRDAIVETFKVDKRGRPKN